MATRYAFVTIAILGVAAIALRVVSLDNSLWVDETYTALVYVRGGPSEILGGDFTINNHILFSLVGWALAAIGGEHEWLLRSAAVVPALGSVLVVARWSWRRFGAVSAIAVSAIIVLNREHLVLSRQARGYGFAYLAAALAVVAADDLLRAPGNRWKASLRYAGAGLVGSASFLFFAAPWLVGSAVLASARRLRQQVLGAVVLVGALTAALYSNALDAVTRSAGDFRHHRSLEPTRFEESVNWIRRWIGVPIAQLTTLADQRFATTITVVVVVPILLAGAWHLVERGEVRLLGYLVAPQIVVHLAAAATHTAMHGRYTAALLVPTAVLFGIGVGELANLLIRTPLTSRLAPIAGLLAVVVLTGRFVEQNMDAVRIPLEDFQSPARELARFEAEAGRVDELIVSKRTYGVQYYFDRPTTVIRTSIRYETSLERLEQQACESLERLAFVTFGGPLEEALLTCVTARGGERHEYQQRTRGGHITLWLLPANSPR